MSSHMPENQEIPLRFMIYHLNPASARLRFLKSSSGQVCHPSPLPKLSDLIDDYQQKGGVAVHPSSYLQSMCELLSVSFDTVSIENDFRCWVDTPARVLPVYLLRVRSESPCPAPQGFQWIELPDCFSLTEVERQMMRHSYQRLME